jgi:2-oxoglutarate ferredoxin oxidoreductase subunit alpha
MLTRLSIKLLAQSGQGIDTIGNILSKSLNKFGYYVVGYREYPSLIKGGNASYKIDFANKQIRSVKQETNIICVLNFQNLKWSLDTISEGGIIIHALNGIEDYFAQGEVSNTDKFSELEREIILKKKITILKLPIDIVLKSISNTNALMGNTVFLSVLAYMFKIPAGIISQYLYKQFTSGIKHSEEKVKLADKNLEIVKYVYAQLDDLSLENEFTKFRTKVNVSYKFLTELKDNNNLFISGNDTLALSAINAGVRAFYAYPMTPISSLLSTLASSF